ncbi:endonuclease domain-containing protein [Micromonospora ureilytica]|uniref:endonuclease domain-containing protein n=1 Tax=Micromonospora ureilytica TaxID=709868 RepID=UPI002E13813E|nr:endonuclease VII domain-containing protein [Micromonospora ureilytica]
MPINSVKRGVQLGDHLFEDSILRSSILYGGNEHWSVDLPTVLSILERIAAGEADAREMRDELLRATKWDSGCCSDCDLAVSHFPKARHRHEESLRQWEEEQQLRDLANLPYVLNKGKIHTSSCRRPPRPAPPMFPEDLHTFAVLMEGYGGNLEQVFDHIADQASGGASQISSAEVTAMMARDGAAAVKSRLCGACKPRLPALDSTAPQGQPACWEWVLPSDIDAVATPGVTPATVNVLPHERNAYAKLERWHDGRCAVCGQSHAVSRLVRNHDHPSGLIRGLLCSSCNTAEGRTDSLLFNNYRHRPPSVILGIEVLYLPAGFQPGTHHLGVSAR